MQAVLNHLRVSLIMLAGRLQGASGASLVSYEDLALQFDACELQAVETLLF